MIFLPSLVPPGNNKIIVAHQLSSAAQTGVSLQHTSVQIILQTFDIFLILKQLKFIKGEVFLALSII